MLHKGKDYKLSDAQEVIRQLMLSESIEGDHIYECIKTQDMINPDNLFNLFPDPEDTNKVDDVEITIVDHPQYKLQKFVNIISNHLLFFKQLNKMMKEKEEGIEEYSSFMVFNRSWYYIKDFDIEDKTHKENLLISDYLEIYECLKKAISYFEGMENYERCTHLYKIQRYIENIDVDFSIDREEI